MDKLNAAVLAAALLAGGTPPAGAEDEFSRFEADEARLRAVNTGELQFLSFDQTGPLHTETSLHIAAGSLQDGWLGLTQCQHRLDAVSVTEIVFGYRGMRGLEITSSSGIESARTDNGSVQLRGVSRGAHVCIRAEVLALSQTDDGGFRILSGPHHRRYLDGYFPLHVALTVSYPPALLAFTGVEPAPQPGLRVQAGEGTVTVEAAFTGKLSLDLAFHRRR